MQSAVHPKVCFPVLAIGYMIWSAHKHNNMGVRCTGTTSHRAKKVRVNLNNLLYRTGC